jgi:hypothetical protein
MSQLILGSVPVAGLVAEANGGPSHPEDAVGNHVLLVVARVECVGGDLRRNKQGNTVGACLGGVRYSARNQQCHQQNCNDSSIEVDFQQQIRLTNKQMTAP